jgi:tetratricopeptide (TPR) repeat protein
MRISRSGRSVAGTFFLILSAIGGLSVIDSFLAKTERLESHREAERLFTEGQRFEQAGNYSRAIDRFRAALSITSEPQDYAVALAAALLKAGRPQEAQSVLSEVLQRNSISGEANLMMARLLVEQGKIAVAESYYHHAIYDQWRDESARHRLEARLELIELLAQHRKTKDLLSELLALQDEAGEDIAILKRIGPLYLAAGAPEHASEAFRDILRTEARNADAYAGLGEASFAIGKYEAAEDNFRHAFALDPRNEQFRTRLELCRRVLELDPTRRGLSMSDRYRRSLEILKLAADDLGQCSAGGLSQSTQELVGTAAERLRGQVKAFQENDATEANLDLADRLWRARLTECKRDISPAEQPLALVLAKIAQ